MVHIPKRGIVFAVFLFALFMITQSVLTPRTHAQSDYYVASMNMTIDPGAEDFVVSSINDATATGAHHFILVMNTFGGSGQNMDNIISAISKYEAAGNNFTTLIAPAGSHAFSAGAYIAESSNKIVVVPGTTIGSATPIVYGIPTGEENTTLTKDINGFAAYMRAITHPPRNPNATEAMVRKGVSYDCIAITQCNALQQGVVDRVVAGPSVSDALTQSGAPVGVEIHTPNIRSTFISVLADPNLDSILFLLGTFAILADVYHPTIILSVVGAAAIALGLLGLGVFGASIVSIILMVIGAAFIFLELKTHHGLSATIGVVIFIVGFLLVFTLPAPASTPPSAPSHPAGNFISIGLLTYSILGVVGGGGVLGSIYLYRIRESLMHRPPTIDPKAIIGKEGDLTTDLTAGQVATARVSAEEYSVTASENLPKGTRIKVKDVQGLKLVVEKAEMKS